MINRETSLYLDIVRFTAAFLVFMNHATGSRFTGGLFWQLGQFGAEAVDVFFVLSGFVIGYVTTKRETGLSLYAIARISRIFSVAIPAIFATFILDQIGMFMNKKLYLHFFSSADFGFWHYVSGLFFINATWWNTLWVGSNQPYWSLGFEVPFYFMFGILFFWEGRSGNNCGASALFF